MRKKTICAALLGVALAGCSSQEPIMSVGQQNAYNQCMSGRWSGEADTFWFGPLGWAYHDSVQKDCYIKVGALGSATVGEQSVAEASPSLTAITPGSSGPAATSSGPRPATASASAAVQPASNPTK